MSSTSRPRSRGRTRVTLAITAAILAVLVVLFFIANGRWGIYWGTGIFIVATAIALPCYRLLEKRWPIMPLVGGFFVLVFSGLTIWLQDDTFIKLKPTIVNCLFGVILGGGLLLFKKPLLKPLFGQAMAERIVMALWPPLLGAALSVACALGYRNLSDRRNCTRI